MLCEDVGFAGDVDIVRRRKNASIFEDSVDKGVFDWFVFVRRLDIQIARDRFYF